MYMCVCVCLGSGEAAVRLSSLGGPPLRPCVREELSHHVEEAPWQAQALSTSASCGPQNLFRGCLLTQGPQRGVGAGMHTRSHLHKHLLCFKSSVILWSRTSHNQERPQLLLFLKFLLCS